MKPLVRLSGIVLVGVATMGLSVTPAQDSKSAKEWNIEEIHGPKLSFETDVDEGTFMSLDVSPDGSTIIFDLLGDLYALPISGGKATRITSGPAWDCQPRYSPDGKHIVFMTDRSGSDQIWIANADGTHAHAVTNDALHQFMSPIYTWDGRSILAVRGDISRGTDVQGVVLFDVNGGPGVDLLNKIPAMGPAPSRDDRYVYYASPGEGGGGLDSPFTAAKLYRLDRRNGQTSPMATSFGAAIRPVVSRDGHLLAYRKYVDGEMVLVVRNLDTDAEHMVYHPLDSISTSWGMFDTDVAPGYAFTPDGRSIVFAAQGKFRKVDVASGAASVIPFTAHIEQTLTEKVYVPQHIDDGPFTLKALGWAQPTPNGQSLIFGAIGKLFQYNIGTKQAHMIADGSGLQYAPAISPDGQWLAYVTWSDLEGGNVYKVSLNGGTPVKLTSRAGRYTNPSWSLDGQKLTVAMAQQSFEEYETVSWDICWLDANHEGDTHVIASTLPRGNRRQDPEPRFDASGERVFYTDARGGEIWKNTEIDLVSARLDGTDVHRLVHFRYADEVVPSPDGRSLAYVERQDAFVVDVPLLGGHEPLLLDTHDPAFPVRKLSRFGGHYFYWLDGGKSICWSWGPLFSRVKLADVAEAQEKAENVSIEVQVPRPMSQGHLLLKNARIITMGKQDVIEHGDLLVENGRIKAVGATGKVSAPADTKVMDMSGKTLMPGMIDIHAHYDQGAQLDTDIHAERDWVWLASLAYGVTTWRDPSARSQSIFTSAEMVEAGRTLGPRIFSTGDIYFFTDEIACCGPIKDLDDAIAFVKRQKEMGADYIKEHTDPTRRQLQWAVEAARRENIMITTDVTGGPRRAVREILDGYTGIEHYFFAPRVYKDVIALMARAGTYWSPTLMVSPGMEHYYHFTTDVHSDPKVRHFTPHSNLDEHMHQASFHLPEEWDFHEAAQTIADIVHGGGKVGLGAHGNRQGIGPHWELWSMQSGGLTTMEALRCATLVPAEAIGLQNDLGSLEAGKLADLIVLNANPLDNIRNSVKIAMVMKAGALWNGDTLDEVWPHQHKLEPLSWERNEVWGK
jgi:Tol biopolymer transport system component/imidazolonepropionase-like amidohydrolase